VRGNNLALEKYLLIEDKKENIKSTFCPLIVEGVCVVTGGEDGTVSVSKH
jgi:hypothetical protein